MAKFQDLTGQRFTRLVVIERDQTQRVTYWVCQCDCGKMKTVSAGNLKTGGVRSCGCLQRETVTVADMIGKRFGRLVVTARAGSKGTAATWLCRCDCGNETIVYGNHLRKGNTKSCGCQRSDSAKLTNRKHGMQGTSEYKRWENAKQRCYNPKVPSYRDYGGRGIIMCDEWRDSFMAFYEAVGPCPGPGYSLDRINNDGNYEPGNVRWLDRSGQMRNRRPIRPFMQRALDKFAELGYTVTPPESGQ